MKRRGPRVNRHFCFSGQGIALVTGAVVQAFIAAITVRAFEPDDRPIGRTVVKTCKTDRAGLAIAASTQQAQGRHNKNCAFHYFYPLSMMLVCFEVLTDPLRISSDTLSVLRIECIQ